MEMSFKNTIKLFYMAVFSILLFGACRDDLSTYDTNKIEGVAFDTTGVGILQVFQFDDLTINPKIVTNLPEGQLEYEWKINPVPGTLWQFGTGAVPFQVIGNEKNLTYNVGFVPTRSFERNDLHEVVLTVTDKETGLQYIQPYPLAIRNSIGEGLVIAETQDGQNTDISHIMAPSVTRMYNDESVKHKIYSTVNSETIPGLVHTIKYTSLRNIGPSMLALTDSKIQSIRTLDFVKQIADQDLFFTPPAQIRPLTLEVFKGGTTFYATLVNDGRTYTDIIGNIGKFALPDDFDFRAGRHIALNRSTSYNYYLNFFDENKGAFIYKQGPNNWNNKNLFQMAAQSSPFNPTGLTGKRVVGASAKENNDFVHVLKDNAGSGIGVYIISASESGVPPTPKRYMDISNAPDIASAQHFIILPDQDVIYYTTKTKIYAILYGAADSHSYAERFTVAGGEEITTAQLFQQADYPNNGYNPDQYIASNNKQLVVSTYGSSQGHVYIMPFTTPGLAFINSSAVKKYSGFGKVLAIGSQL